MKNADVAIRPVSILRRDVLAQVRATSPFLGYQPTFADSPYPAVLCASVNDAGLHDIPGRRRLKDGDLLSIDCGAPGPGLVIAIEPWFPRGRHPQVPDRPQRLDRPQHRRVTRTTVALCSRTVLTSRYHQLAGHRVQRPGLLVGEQHFGPGDQAAGERDALRLPAGPPGLKPVQPEPGEPRAAAIAGPRRTPDSSNGSATFSGGPGGCRRELGAFPGRGGPGLVLRGSSGGAGSGRLRWRAGGPGAGRRWCRCREGRSYIYVMHACWV